jgi:hypothetical protein
VLQHLGGQHHVKGLIRCIRVAVLIDENQRKSREDQQFDNSRWGNTDRYGEKRIREMEPVIVRGFRSSSLSQKFVNS